MYRRREGVRIGDHRARQAGVQLLHKQDIQCHGAVQSGF